jgi:hypothetical protein
MNRHVAAFLLAPLAMPLVMSAVTLQILREVSSLYWFGLLIAAVVSYAGVFLVAPVYMMLRSHGWSAFWIAPVAGFMVGVIVAIGLIAVLPAVLQSGALSYILEMLPGMGEVIIAPQHPNLVDDRRRPSAGIVRPGHTWSARRHCPLAHRPAGPALSSP